MTGVASGSFALRPATPRDTRLLLPIGIFAVAAVVGVARLTGLSEADGTLAVLLPMDGATDDLRFGSLAIAGFSPLLLGLVRGKRFAWAFAVATFGVAGLGALIAARQPLAIAVLGPALVILMAGRRRFDVRTGPGATRLLAAALLVCAVVVLVASTAGSAAFGPSWFLSLGQGVAAALGVGDADTLAGSAASGPVVWSLLSARLLVVIASLAILGIDADGPTVESDRARAIARVDRDEGDALLPFQVAADKQLFGVGDLEALVSFGRRGRVNVVLGDPLGAPEPAWQVFGRFLEDARRRDRQVGVYQASESGRGILRDAGWRTFLVGQEAVVELDTFDLRGSERANLRHTITRARRGGVTVHWFPAGVGTGDAQIRAGMAEVDTAWRRRSGPQMGFTIGRYSEAEIEHVAASVATDPDARVLGFATFRPTGASGDWVLDLVRRRRDATPGVMESCIVTAATELRAGGARRLSLGLAPASGISRPGAQLEERLIAAAVRAVRRWYDVDGLRFFKAKFDPRWKPRFAAVPRAWDEPAFGLALLSLHLGGLRGLVRQVVRR